MTSSLVKLLKKKKQRQQKMAEETAAKEEKLTSSRKKKTSSSSSTKTNDSQNTSTTTSSSDSKQLLPFNSFSLHDSILEACKKLNFTHATQIQAKTFEACLHDENRSLIGIADTGSGKTLSFLLPALHHLLTSEAHASPCSVLILEPTRELAQQVKNVANAFAKEVGINTTLLCGGEDMEKQLLDMQRDKSPLVIGTPGRIAQLLRTKKFNLNFTRYLILDEADKMLGVEYHSQVLQIVTKTYRRNATYLYSATMTKQVKKLQKLYLDPEKTVKIQVNERKYSTVDTLSQKFLFVPEKNRPIFLTYLLNELSGKRIIVFASENATCVQLSIMLRSLGFSAVPLAGLMRDQDRLSCLNRFQAGESPILIATDIAARGLDIPDVEVVINYELPVRSKDYIHRVGRTARIGRTGEAITIVSQYDLEYFQKIEQLTGVKMDEYPHTKEHIKVLEESVNEAWNLAQARMKDQDKFPEATNNEDRVIGEAINALTKKRKRKTEKHQKRKKSKQGGNNNNKRR